MSELQELKSRVISSGPEGVLTSQIKDDYDPIGKIIISNLCESGEFVQRRYPANDYNSKWRLFKSGNEPY